MRNPHFFQKCCHFCWLCFDFSKNDNTFERNEDCATVFLKWTDFRELFVNNKENKLLSILARICLVPHCIDAMMWLWTLLIDVCTTKWKKGRKMERMKEKNKEKKGKLNQRWNSLSLMWHFRHLKSVFRCFLRTHRDLIYLKRIMCSSLRKIFD